MTVIDATNVQEFARKPLLDLAKKYHRFAVAIAFNLPESVCQERNKQRPDRQFGSHVVRNHTSSLKRSLARREFALGVESLNKFVDSTPLRQVYECVFGVLALESEPVDPRL